MKNIECINLKYKGLIVNQDKYGNKIENCYSDDGNCRDCRYYRECEWFLYKNEYK
ncbi:hypothetical protein H9L25_00565 [Terrisporobacter mayombei]|nr:hypothetical protein [Terrisporobacter mayombei]